ncbi:hypothetical protein IAQ61_009113 [Plenodomus lingam]|uniref:uncharacterized protein n=1 Tax=Leptosphaeria maculans TaxID=5022 RepID=UPI0033347FF8|nr:hypothetical protein IAQ61_009113 [Plenodomus lingam]
MFKGTKIQSSRANQDPKPRGGASLAYRHTRVPQCVSPQRPAKRNTVGVQGPTSVAASARVRFIKEPAYQAMGSWLPRPPERFDVQASEQVFSPMETIGLVQSLVARRDRGGGGLGLLVRYHGYSSGGGSVEGWANERVGGRIDRGIIS